MTIKIDLTNHETLRKCLQQIIDEQEKIHQELMAIAKRADAIDGNVEGLADLLGQSIVDDEK